MHSSLTIGGHSNWREIAHFLDGFTSGLPQLPRYVGLQRGASTPRLGVAARFQHVGEYGKVSLWRRNVS